MVTPGGRRVQIGGFDGERPRPVPMDIWVLLGVVLFTLTLATFETTRGLVEPLRLSAESWSRGFVWQLGAYPFIGHGTAGIWFLLELFILGLFGKDVFWRLGRKGFWMLIAWATISAALAAVAVDVAAWLLGASPTLTTFVIMQGQHMLVVTMIAAFSVLYRDATILLFFILPVKAGYFLWIEVLFAFMAFLGSKDFAGFVGICVGIAVTAGLLNRGRARRGVRGWRRSLRESWLRLQQAWMRWRLDRMRKQRGFRVVRGEGRRDWRVESDDEDPDGSDDGGAGGSDGGGDGGKDGGNGVHRGPWVH